MQLLKQRSSPCKRPGENGGRRAHSPRGRAPSAVRVRQLSGAPRAPRPRCASTPPSGGSPSHLAVIGQSGPCLVPTGPRSCPFLGCTRPSRPRIPARPRGRRPPPPPRPAPSPTPRALGAWERRCLPGAPGYRRHEKDAGSQYPRVGAFPLRRLGGSLGRVARGQNALPEHTPSMGHWELLWRGRGTQDTHPTHRDPSICCFLQIPGLGSCGQGALNYASPHPIFNLSIPV